jgi:hypothetical protein
VELLTVVVIISLLAGMSLLALTGTMTAAKESKTRGTIAKLDAAILDIYESYQERFDSITITDANLTAAGVPINDRNRALAKLHFICDIMRLEMPYKWEEISHNASAALHEHKIPIGTYHVLTQPPPVLEYYHNALTSITNGSTINSQSPSAELLFLIIANLNPEALENFHGSEIGDIDGNGLREFHDAWGNPIQFIRWAPAFTGSDLQPDVVTISNYPLGNTGDWEDPITITDTNWDSATTTLISPKKELVNAMSHTGYSDPFDPDGHINRTWFVYPLIVSGGADGSVDLTFDTIPTTTLPATATINATTNILHPAKYPWGLPADTDNNGVLNHYDNIHNHRSSNSF